MKGEAVMINWTWIPIVFGLGLMGGLGWAYIIVLWVKNQQCKGNLW